jgi:hypothetical protein
MKQFSKWASYSLAALALCGASGTAAKVFATSSAGASSAVALYGAVVPSAVVSTSIYEDALAAGWQNWSWGSSVNLGASSPVQAGARSVSVGFNSGWSGFFLHHDGLSTTGRKYLQFWIHGGTSGRQSISVYAEDSTGRAPVPVPLTRYIAGGAVAANAWRFVSVPLAALRLGSSTLTGLTWQDATGGSQPQFFLDSVRLVGDGTAPTPTPVPTPAPTATPLPTPPGAPVGAIPAALGSNFLIGLSSLPGDYAWMRSSGVPWSARYTYLTGGVNTLNNWTLWNSPSGQYATYYLNDSGAANTLPIFTYYQILASNPRPYDEQLPAYLEKFNNAATMRAYFDDWKLLMRKCAAFNRPVVVHVEPDTWGYMMMTRATPGAYAVRVASSGHPEAASLPNTAAGFAQMLVRLRARYAPKVLLALHASAWSAGTDVTLNKDAAYGIKANAERTGAWLNGLGAGWDLVFVDVADRDAAYKKIVRGQDTWWDETNRTLPNFNRVAQWLAFLNRKMARRLVVWQVPVGNTKRLSCNNTPGHYQDNRVQYFLDAAYGTSHLAQWARSGVVGLLFGRGDGNTTTNTDARGDGVTNPAPINGNTGRATVADDDGGYFRQRAAAYFRAPIKIPGAP